MQARTRNPHGSLKLACENCHTATSWKPLRTQPEFDHNRETRFALRGSHTEVACGLCHVEKVFTSVGKQCSDCHADLHRRQFGANCQECHTVNGWRVAVSSIKSHLNRFPLVGAHVTATCDSCHRGAASGTYTGLSTACSACHLADYQKAANPNHVASNMPTTCENCHGADRWAGAKFDHDRFTRFPLTAGHARVECASCHRTGYRGTSTECSSCHLADFNRTSNPNHASAGFPRDCTMCHNNSTWPGARFDHNAATRFTLTGAHVSTQCVSCHVAGRFTGTPQDCLGCHTRNFEATTNPDHRRSNFSTRCESCHTASTWTGAKFDHDLSRFRLTGAHVSADCGQCHTGGRYTGISTDCAGCHRQVFESAANPNHVAAGFPSDCTVCHTTQQWRGARFDHNTATSFTLTGAHTTTTCGQCHASNVYKGTATACSGCHMKDYTQAASPNHAAASFPTDCATCHVTQQWRGARFDHNTATKFALTGAHSRTTCGQCHVSNVYKGTATACSGCHMKDYTQSTSPNHAAASFPTDCTVCHVTQQWRGARFDHNTATRFALAGAHVSTSCRQCHISNVFKGTASTCEGCHMKDFNATTNPNHATAAFPTTCTMCHESQQWRGARFDHNRTRFPLNGAHANQTCTQCHGGGRYTGLSSQCSACHLQAFQSAGNPNHVAAGFPSTCESCHTSTTWRGAKFDHNTSTRFSLTGGHLSASCGQCHVNSVFKGTSARCEGCHLTAFQQTANPNHTAAGFPVSCDTCHNTAVWRGARFDHNAATRFALTGSHTTVQCSQCHVNSVFKGTASQCQGCHLTAFQRTANPNHAAAGFPQDCTMCHSTGTWRGARFDHNAATRFALTGSHTTVQCSQCHVNSVFKGTASQCQGCHLTAFQRTTNPNHAAAGFPQDCTVCHSTSTWRGAQFDHTRTRFPLTGAHISRGCADCHNSGRYTGVSTQCSFCHLQVYQSTTNPNHAAAGFPHDCTVCHTTAAWRGARFDHTAATRFPLTGSHVAVQCGQCHVNNQYRGTATTCEGCHLSTYQRTTSPAHAAAGFPSGCQMCHNTAGWRGAVFDHNTATRFRLTGAHITKATCNECHAGNRFAGTPSTCAGCHLNEYSRTSNPPHAAVRFPTDCSLCHTTTAWPGGRFDHSTTRFPLTGAHTTKTCTQCHTGGRWTGLDTTCAGCHLRDYQATTNPAHASAGFPATCQTCHSTATWRGAVFDHARTRFALTGKHTTVQCALCHVGGRFTGTPTDCYSCHVAVYRTVTNPNHVAAGFPTTCQTCHTTTAWTGATFNHRFPIFTGKHQRGVWNTCSDCHVNQSNYQVFECINCHEHNRTKMDDKHKNLRGYAYNSITCYSCHANGRKP